MAEFWGEWMRSRLWVRRSLVDQGAGTKTVTGVGDSHYSKLRR
ncbi:MAG TPA: hypothetical protein V6D27_11630 [Vampirovibrionales bacterium]